jgi:hypothetical protein
MEGSKMKKVFRSILVLALLLIVFPATIFADTSTREDTLASLSNAEVIAYIGNSGSIGMADAAHPSMLYRLLDDNKKNDNSLIGSSNQLLKELEDLERIFNSLDPDQDYKLLERESKEATGFWFTERLLILKKKLEWILDLLPESGINNEKQLNLIQLRIEMSIEIGFNMTSTYNPICVDLSDLEEGASVEGWGTLFSYFNISTPTGGAVKIVEGGSFNAYGSPNDKCNVDSETPPPIIHNGGIAFGGGFSDMNAVGENQEESFAHEYTFSFDGVTISRFSLHMLDFGDWNPSTANYHRVEMIAYNVTNDRVSTQVLEYSSDGTGTPRSSEFGDLQCNNGDASAESDMPGNWSWNVLGEGITEVTLTFPDGYDPYIGFDTLCFVVEP